MKYEKLHLKEHFAFLGNKGADATLELYLPYNMSEMGWENKKRPCILVLPGGAYRFCSQRESEPIALHFLPEGCNVFVLTYSTKPYCHPQQMLEVAAAMELIYQRAEEWNCDTSKIVIMGFSAGGHLAAHYSTMYDCPEVWEKFPESKAVSGAVLCYPVITADMSFTHQESIRNLCGHEPTEAEIRRFSNENNVKNTTPPTFLWHTAADETVPVRNSIVYADALAREGVPFELHVYPKGRHGLSTSDKHSCDDVNADSIHNSVWLASLKQWLKDYIW